MNARVRLLRLEGPEVTLHFSPGYRERAAALYEVVQDAHRFLSEWLGVEAHTTLGVLRGESWRRLRRAPYGYPHSNPATGTIYVPAHYPPSFIERARRLYERAPEILQQRLCRDRSELKNQITTFYDLVAIHELGHLFIHHLRLGLGTQWLTELVANLFATAYFLEMRPDDARCWLNWAEIQSVLEVRYRSLAEYEIHYANLDFANANYYQGRFNLKAVRLWEQHGRAIVPRLVEQFSQRSELVEERFKRIVPSFEW